MSTGISTLDAKITVRGAALSSMPETRVIVAFKVRLKLVLAM